MGVYEVKLKRERLVKAHCDLSVSNTFFYQGLEYFFHLFIQLEQVYFH